MAGNPAPDWYPDPDDPALLRWWDGTRWSGETRVAHHALGDAPDEYRAAGVPSGSPGGDATGLQASWREPALRSWAAAYRSAGPAPGARTPAVRRWVLAGAAVVIVAVVAAWLLLFR